jgi:hypothetical protein
VQQRTTKEGTLKIIFCFAATGDSTAHPKKRTQMEDEDFDAMWLSVGDVGRIISREDDRKNTERGLQGARSEGCFPLR